MDKRRTNPRKDINETAFSVVQQAIGEAEPQESTKDQDAVESGRRGGLKGGKARASKLTPEERAEIARKAAAARWNTETD